MSSVHPRESSSTEIGPSFAVQLAIARRQRKPFVALRPDDSGALDDVVIKDVEMFRAEMMSNSSMWMACHLRNGESIDFYVSAGKNHRAVLNFGVSEFPDPEKVYYETGSLR